MLESAGLIARTRDGRVHRISLVTEPMLDGLEWIAVFGRFWKRRLDGLERFLAVTTEDDDDA